MNWFDEMINKIYYILIYNENLKILNWVKIYLFAEIIY